MEGWAEVAKRSGEMNVDMENMTDLRQRLIHRSVEKGNTCNEHV